MRKCDMCGKEFEPRPNQRYCCAECKAKAAHLAAIRQEENRKERILKRKTYQNQSIVDIAVAARKAGMTYGQYVMKMGL